MSFATIIRTARTASLSVGLRPAAAHCARLSHNQASNSSIPSDTVPQPSISLSTPEKREEIRTDWEVKIITYNEFLPKTQHPENVRYNKL